MSTPLERRIRRRINKSEENNFLYEHNQNITKAFGIPPRFKDSILMNTTEGKQLLVSAKIPKDSVQQRRYFESNNKNINRTKKLQNRKDPEKFFNNEATLDNLKESISNSKEKDFNSNFKSDVIENVDSDEFDSIFRSVSDDLEQLSKRMSESINNTYISPVNLTSSKLELKKEKSASNKFSEINIYPSEEDSYKYNDNSPYITDSFEYSRSSDSSTKTPYISYLNDQKIEKGNINGINDKQVELIDNLIKKLSSSINKLKNMVIGKDKFTSLLREQMQKSNNEIIRLSQKVDLLQKELVSTKRGKEKYKDSMKKLLNEMQKGKLDGTINSYIMEIQALKQQNERAINNLNTSEIALIQLQTEKEKLLEEKDEFNNKINQLEEKIRKLNLVVSQVTEEKLHLLEMKDNANNEIEKLLENIKSCNDENKISLEELKRGYELNDLLQDHVMLLKAQLEIITEEKNSQEKVIKDLKDETDTIKQNLKSLEHRESILLSALEDSSYRMTDIDKALEEQKSEYESLLKKESEKYINMLNSFKVQSEELEITKRNLEVKTEEEKEQRKVNEELQRKFGSFESHIRRLLDARDNEIMQLNDYMDGKLKKKEEETNQKIQEICKIQQEREKRLINQMLDQHDGFERKRMEYEHEINLIRSNFNEKLDKAVKLENEKQLRLAETLVNKEHELMLKENVIKEIDEKKMHIEQQLREAKLYLNELTTEKNKTVEKLLSLEQWGVLIQTINQMNPELQSSLNERLTELRNKVESLEKQEDSISNAISQNHTQVEIRSVITNESRNVN